MGQAGGYRVAFVMSHPFQFDFFEAPARLLKDPVFVIETRKDTPFTFSREFLARLPGTVVTVDTNDLKDLDGGVDVLVCLTPIPVLKLFERTKVVCIQYSLSKETYQYGSWRAVADLNLMFGPYSLARVAPFCTAEVVGNPRFDGRLPGKRAKGAEGIAYLPTYGELSSLTMFERYLETRSGSRPVTIRPHHMSEFTDQEALERLALHPDVTLLSAYDDSLALIQRSAVVVSDFSGAAFDAAAAGAPVVLIQPDSIPAQATLRTTADSLEVAGADRIGPVVRSADAIEAAVEGILTSDSWKASRAALVDECFANMGDAGPRIVSALDRLMEGGYERDLANRQLSALYHTYLTRTRSLQRSVKASQTARRKAEARVKEEALKVAKLTRTLARLKAAAAPVGKVTKAKVKAEAEAEASTPAPSAPYAPRVLSVPKTKKKGLFPW